MHLLYIACGTIALLVIGARLLSKRISAAEARSQSPTLVAGIDEGAYFLDVIEAQRQEVLRALRALHGNVPGIAIDTLEQVSRALEKQRLLKILREDEELVSDCRAASDEGIRRYLLGGAPDARAKEAADPR